MPKPVHFALLLISIAALLAACSSTTLNSSWKDPEFRGPLHKVYIVGVARQEVNRRIFEDAFVRELASSGVTAVASYNDLPPGDDSQDAVIARLAQHGADAVLMARMVNMRLEQVTSPGYMASSSLWDSYYPLRYEAIDQPPLTTEFEIATIETNIYNTASGKLIWSARLETVAGGDTQSLIDDFVKTVANDLQKQGLIR